MACVPVPLPPVRMEIDIRSRLRRSTRYRRSTNARVNFDDGASRASLFMRVFAPLFARLSHRYHLVAPDYPGFGHSA
jgi:pimeloyl-ACP methyl ester carboxylesterase